MKNLFLFYLLSIPFIAISQDFSKYVEVSTEKLTAFDASRCDSIFTKVILGNQEFPKLYRTKTPNRIFKNLEWMQFEVYFLAEDSEKLYLTNQGMCRGFSVSFSVKHKGIYFVRIFHESKPCLIQIDVDQNKITENFLGICALHE